jgi:predicted TIM-barrel fold metal-dependent hydrolase
MSKNRVHDARRREFLSALAAFGAATLVRGPAIARQAAGERAADAKRIDLHHHFASPRWSRRHAEIKRQGWETFQDYKPSQSLEAMDKAGIQTAYLSVTNPGVWFTDDYDGERQTAVALARDMNEFAARMVADYKGRFGLFATLPLRDIDASLREIEYAFDTLKADGVGLVTSYGDMWLGDVRFQPIFDELNRRRAIVYTHPTDGTCCHNLLPNTQPGTVEWNTDTGESLYSVLADGIQGRGAPSAAKRYSNITFIWSHGGGTLLGLVGRFNLGIRMRSPIRLRIRDSRSSASSISTTAGSANPVTMQALKTLVGPSQIVYGTDYPFGGANGPANIVRNLQRCGFTAAELSAMKAKMRSESLVGADLKVGPYVLKVGPYVRQRANSNAETTGVDTSTPVPDDCTSPLTA